MGVPVPMAPPPTSGDDAAGSTQAAQTKATRQPDGSIQTASTAPGKGLPPMALKQPGWPDLPPENTATFSSVQPATVLPGTKLYAASDGADADGTSYWSSEPPDPSSPADSGNDAQAGSDADAGAADPDASPEPGDAPDPAASPYLSSGGAAAVLAKASPMLPAATHVAVLAVTSPAGLKAWAGTAASRAANQAANQAASQAVAKAPGLLVYAPPAAVAAAAAIQHLPLPPSVPRPGKLPGKL